MKSTVKVGIAAYAVGARHGGIETYLRNVIREIGNIDPDGDYALIVDRAIPPGSLPGSERMRQVVLDKLNPVVRIPFWNHGLTFVPWKPPTGALQLALLRHGIDVVHVQLTAPILCPSRVVVSLHDIVFEHYPQFFPPDFLLKMRVSVPLTVRRAAAILTLSESSKRDIVHRYRVPPDKVVVTHCAADPRFRPIHDATPLANVRARYSTGQHFILYVGNLEPHKNLKTLIDAYVRLRQADATRYRLVLAGHAVEVGRGTAIFEAARASGYMDDLVFTGYVPDEDVVALYNAADLFVFPSLFEGFGLPPLEAMACGTPVVCSNTSSLPEVVGDAALTVDPRNVEALASAIATLLNDAGLRARLVDQGLQRANSFSWSKTTRSILDVYRQVGQG